MIINLEWILQLTFNSEKFFRHAYFWINAFLLYTALLVKFYFNGKHDDNNICLILVIFRLLRIIYDIYLDLSERSLDNFNSLKFNC